MQMMATQGRSNFSRLFYQLLDYTCGDTLMTVG